MKTILLSILASLFAVGSSPARNPEPLRFRGTHTPPANPIRRVVLVHGFLENGSTYRTLRNRLEKQGVACLVAKLQPNDGRGGLVPLAVQLKQQIETAYGPTEPISIVAFSMGGLVSRYYLQNLGGARRCEKLLTISSPHHGTEAARFYPTQGTRDMRPGSRFLADLTATESKLGKLPVVSYRTPMDLVILPPTSSVWQRAKNLEYPVSLHALMLTSHAVLSDIEERLLE